MPHVQELSANLQAKLLKPVVEFFNVKVILDPDDLNIDLSDDLDLEGGWTISKKKSIDPYSGAGRYTISEIRIPLKRRDKFNQNLKGETFYYETSRLYEAVTAGTNQIKIPKGDGDKFSVNMKINIQEGTTSENAIIQSIDSTTYTYYDLITLSANLANDFGAGALVEVLYLPGRKIIIKNTFNGISDEIIQFVGILKNYPDLNKKQASIVIQDIFSTILGAKLKANDYRTLLDLDGTFLDNISYSRVKSSNGTFNPDTINFNPKKCKIGTWTIHFDTTTDFTVTDPDGYQYTGNVNSPFFAGTSSDYQLSWSGPSAFGDSTFEGSFDIGDEITFKTTCSFGPPTNNYRTIPEMLYRLLVEDFGAGLTDADLALSTFTDLMNEYEEMMGVISFTQETSILKAIEKLQAHINATLYFDNNGKFALSCYRPQRTPSTIYALSPSADIVELRQEDLGRIEAVVAHYDYDPDTGEYRRRAIIPANANFQNKILELNFPAYRGGSYGQARAAAERIYFMWRRGLRAFEIKEKFNYGIAFDIDEIYQITSNNPQVNGRYVQIYEIKKDLMGKELTIKAYDIDFHFGQFAFCDVDHCDRGKLTW